MTDFPSADEFRAQAMQWRELAEQTDDLELAEQYDECAAKYEAKADSAEIEGSIH